MRRKQQLSEEDSKYIKKWSLPKKIVVITAIILALIVSLMTMVFLSNTLYNFGDEDVVEATHVDKPISVATIITSTIERILEPDPDSVSDNETPEEPPAITGDGKTVYVDAGHGCRYTDKDHPGPYGWSTAGAAGEADYVEEMRILISDELTQRGYTVVQISDLYLNGVQGSRTEFGNKGRALLAKNNPVDIAIQLHYDGIATANASGGHAIYNDDRSIGSLDLASAIISKWNEGGIKIVRSVPNGLSKRTDLAVYANQAVGIIPKPFILLEFGFGGPGQMDYALLRDASYKDKLVKYTCDGVDLYFQGR